MLCQNSSRKNSEDIKNYTESVDGILEINRSFEIVKRNESEFEKNKDELEIYYTNRSGADFLDETAIEDFLPEALSEYVWFQGESIKINRFRSIKFFKEVVDSIST